MNIQKYKIGVVIDFFHDYFVDKRCHLILQSTEETKILLAKHDILIRRQGYSWILLMPKREDTDYTSEDIILEFNIICPDNLFYYYTIPNNIRNEKKWNVEYIGRNGIYCKLKILLNENLHSDISYHIPVIFESQYKYWEYILIPKFTDFGSRIKLAEAKNIIQFTSLEVINFLDKQYVYRILTTEKIKLKEKYEYKLRLSEILNNGEKILNNSIQYPRPQSISTISSKDTITSFVYY